MKLTFYHQEFPNTRNNGESVRNPCFCTMQNSQIIIRKNKMRYLINKLNKFLNSEACSFDLVQKRFESYSDIYFEQMYS